MGNMIKQALSRINAYKKGNVKDAERIYKAILKSQLSHPDVIHNLGLIEVSTNKPKLALHCLKVLQVNPDIEQFWLSYIDAIIKAKFFKEASKAIKKLKKGFDAEKLDTLLYKSRDIKDAKIPSQKQLISLSELYQNGKFIEAESSLYK